MFAEMIFNISTFFKGQDDYDQLAKIVGIMGMDGLRDYLRKYRLNLPSQCAQLISATQ